MKTSGTLTRVTIETTPEAEDAIFDLLSRVLQQPAATYFDLESGRTTVSVFLDPARPLSKAERDELSAGLKRIADCGLVVGRTTVKVSRIPRRRWADSWKRHFKPLMIGRNLLIRPSWSRKRAVRGQAEVILDPGLSFGTGQHPTTEFCLRELASRRSVGRQSFLDLGCGSGILAISAVKLGYSPVVALELDPEALTVAKENAARNSVLSRISFDCADVRRLSQNPKSRYSFVAANLIADLLIENWPRITATVAPGGCLALAGILDSEFSTVERAYSRRGWRLTKAKAQKEWRSGLWTRA